MNRQQTVLFAPTLDSMISEYDPVRLFDEILSSMDWTLWEAEYPRTVGQPPIHPRHMAAGMLYGLYRRIRSTRQLEEACCYRLDFVWLLEGRQIDHSTFSKFRTKFRQPLKDMFQQIGRHAMTLGLIRLCEVAFDGTRVKANNSRYATRTAKTLEKKLEALGELFDQMMAELDAAEKVQQSLDGEDDSPTRLPEPLAQLDQRRQQVQAALEKAKAADEARRKKGVNAEKNPAQVCTTDSESPVMPNKEGGYAPNYTPTATTDGHRGFIVDADVVAEVNESPVAVASVDRMEETFGQKPEKFLTDGGNNSGQIMDEMEQREVEFYAPVESGQPEEGSPARRDDPGQAVPEAEWSKLRRNSQGRLDKSCFVYDAEQDQYYYLISKTPASGRATQRASERSGVYRAYEKVHRLCSRECLLGTRRILCTNGKVCPT
jgi:transposase